MPSLSTASFTLDVDKAPEPFQPPPVKLPATEVLNDHEAAQ
jgi:hypothetical protein